jgi:cytochrome c556
MALRILTAKTILLLTLVALPAWIMAEESNAQETSRKMDGDSEELVLRSIMRELDENMRKVVGAISRESWEQVAEIAPLIADHPEPPLAEKTRILRFLGADAARFVGHDRQVNEAAMDMSEKAIQEDGEAVIDAFSRVQKHCLGCHQEFKEEFKLHFYGE